VDLVSASVAAVFRELVYSIQQHQWCRCSELQSCTTLSFISATAAVYTVLAQHPGLLIAGLASVGGGSFHQIVSKLAVVFSFRLCNLCSFLIAFPWSYQLLLSILLFS